MSPTLYDETHAGKWYSELQIPGSGNRAALIAHLEHHDPNTDGHFDICITKGDGNFFSQDLSNSILEKHRQQIKVRSQEVIFMNGMKANTLGQVFVPILSTNAKSGKVFRIVLNAYVMEGKTWMGMFVSHPSWIKDALYKKGRWEHVCNFGKGNAVKGKG